MAKPKQQGLSGLQQTRARASRWFHVERGPSCPSCGGHACGGRGRCGPCRHRCCTGTCQGSLRCRRSSHVRSSCTRCTGEDGAQDGLAPACSAFGHSHLLRSGREHLEGGLEPPRELLEGGGRGPSHSGCPPALLAEETKSAAYTASASLLARKIAAPSRRLGLQMLTLAAIVRWNSDHWPSAIWMRVRYVSL